MVKAVAGGGGRGMRPVLAAGELEEAFTRCRSEATAAFGSGDLYVEQLVRPARHIEVQVIGDGLEVAHLWERDCSLQRQRQKLVEFAPAPNLEAGLRQRLLDAALTLARAANYRSLGTFEFLVDGASGAFYFIEANPRLQVEHTVTEAVTGLDLVELQLRLASGATLAELGLGGGAAPAPRGMAMQLRIDRMLEQFLPTSFNAGACSNDIIHKQDPLIFNCCQIFYTESLFYIFPSFGFIFSCLCRCINFPDYRIVIIRYSKGIR